MSTIDFRSNQIQVNKIIANDGTGSISSSILVYGIGADGSPANQGNINTSYFPQGGIGRDVFFFVSGAIGSRGTTQAGTSVFGGDVVVSGSFYQGNINGVNGGIYSHTEGENTRASGIAAHAEGSNTTASGSWSHAEGYNTLASASFSHAEGSNTTASGSYSHSEGLLSLASGVWSHSEGYAVTASAITAHAEGYYSLASAGSAHSEGAYSIASGDSSHTEGYDTMTSGLASHAEGLSTLASGSYSHAEGEGTEAKGASSHAEGYYTLAFGDYSHAEGSNTVATGIASHAAGNTTVAFADSQSVVGKFNVSSNTDSLFVVGDGLNTGARHDVLRVNSGSVQVTGSFISPKITGSIRYVDNGNTIPYLVANGSATVNYNSSGQWEVTSSGGPSYQYASDGATTSGTGTASTSGTGASSTFTLSGSAGATYGFTTSVQTAPRIIWTMPAATKKITLYSRITATNGWSASLANRYLGFALKYIGDSGSPTTVLFGLGITGDGTVTIGDKRTGANVGTGPSFFGTGFFEPRTADTWIRMVWDLEQQVMTYNSGVGTSTTKPSLWRVSSGGGAVPYIYATSSTGDWPLTGSAQLVASIQSFDTTTPGFDITMQPEIISE